MSEAKEKMVRAKFFGANMRQLRKERGFTTENLANFIGISTAYVGLIERGERCPSLETFLRICDFLGESPEVMLADRRGSIVLRERKSRGKLLTDEQTVVLNMLKTFDTAELEHVIGMVKSFKEYSLKRKK